MRRGLALRISISILAAVLLIFSVILFYNYRISRQLIIKNVRENVINLGHSTVNAIENVLESVQSVPYDTKALIEEFPDVNQDGIKRFMHSLVKRNNQIYGSCMAFEPYKFRDDIEFYAPYFYKFNDSVICRDLAHESYQYVKWDWYRLSSESKKSMWTEPYFDEGGGNIVMCTFSVPFYYSQEDSTDFRGILTADVSLDWLKDFMGKIKVYQHGYSFLISKEGRFISHPREELILHQTIFTMAEEKGMPSLKEAGEAMIGGQTGFIPYKSLLYPGNCYLVYMPIPLNEWSLGIVIPQNELFADLHSLYSELIIMGIVGFIALLMIILVISQRITRPLNSLAAVTKIIGEGKFDATLPAIRRKDEIAQLTLSIGRMQNHLKTYINNLKETTAARERIESELKIARDIQKSIIPKTFPPYPERKDVDIFALLEPAREVGGDLYDFFFLEKDILCFAIGDVSGKGVPASLFMAITRTLLRAKASPQLTPDKIVMEINDDLCTDNDNAMFVTFFLGVIDLKTGKVQYCNAGHNQPIVIHTDGSVEKTGKRHGIALGTLENAPYGMGNFHLKPGESVFLYTDGVTEANDLNGNFYGEGRLTETLGSVHDKKPEKITEAVMTNLATFTGDAEQFDDITILELAYYGK